MLKVIFFDAAGTLFDACVPIAQSYARIARKHGVDAGVEAVDAGFRRAFHQAPPLAFGPGRPLAQLRELERRWWREVVADTFASLASFADFQSYFDELFAFFGEPTNWQIDSSAIPTLQALREQDLKIGVVSNFDYRLYHILDGLGLHPYFDSITISSEAGFAKPAPEIFHVALAKHHATPSEAIHVGDSPHHDRAGARAAGIRNILLDPQQSEHAGSNLAEPRVASLRAVAEIVRQLHP
jgi:putative hydrolase of the HAD superfamily